MAVIVFGETLTLDGVDVTESVLAWQLQQVGRDVPTVTLELRHNVNPDHAVLFEGYANVRIATQAMDALEFLNAVDGEQLTKLMLEDGNFEDPIGTQALNALRSLAQKISP